MTLPSALRAGECQPARHELCSDPGFTPYSGPAPDGVGFTVPLRGGQASSRAQTPRWGFWGSP